jgi:hypothetical protein
MVDEIAQACGKGFIKYWRGDTKGAVDILLPLKPKFHLLGGSILDNEIAVMTLIEATVRCRNHRTILTACLCSVVPNRRSDIEHGDDAYTHGLMLARALLAERTSLKPGSAQVAPADAPTRALTSLSLSAQAWLRYASVLNRLGDDWRASQARRTAYALGIGQGGHGAN